MRKKDIFSLITNPTRNIIITRLDEAEKAAYSDLLDSTDYILPLNSTGNFNYHLNFLLKNSIITKEGIVYKLTEKGREISKYLKDIDEKWKELEKILRGGKMSILNIAEQFEEETGIIMDKEVSDFQGIEIIMDENKILGIMTLDKEHEILDTYEQLNVTDFKIIRKIGSKKVDKKNQIISVLHHPEIEYYLSPKLYGIVQDFLERNHGDSLIYANKITPAPFIISSKKIGEWRENCSFVIAPSIFDKPLKDKDQNIKNE
ncbi:MAG: hypothetical protein HGN29_01295 [Asgard group archaeon]|nr:hypothetical protein [Asgard group archaeon]